MNISLKGISPWGGGTLIGVRGKKEDEPLRRRKALRRVDKELEKGNYKAALSLIKQLQGKPGGGLQGFGSAKLIPKRISKIDIQELNGAENMPIQLLVDSIHNSIKCSLQFSLEEKEEEQRSIGSLAGSNAGTVLAMESLAPSDCSSSLSSDREMCLKHEAGHFLVGYLLGVLPKRYKIPSMEDLMRDNYAGGKIEFVGFEFLKEATTSSISSKTLNRFLCVILGGLVAEHFTYGYSELLHSDVEKLYRVLMWSGYTEDDADFQVNWAIINTVLILIDKKDATSRLAEAMASEKTIGFCIDVLECTFNSK